MSEPTVTPYGEWPSPITAESLVSGAVGMGSSGSVIRKMNSLSSGLPGTMEA